MSNPVESIQRESKFFAFFIIINQTGSLFGYLK